MADDWQPGASRAALVARARLLATIRAFLDARDVLEVTTPVLGGAGASDVHLSNIEVPTHDRRLYLQTSPEFAMKRLLAAGSGAVYQIAPAFRGGESGWRHNIEFTMLEWYRPAMSLEALTDEVVDLIRDVCRAFGLDDIEVEEKTYRELFEARYQENPHQLSLDGLRALAASEYPDRLAHIEDHGDDGTRNDLLDLLFASGIEPNLTPIVVVRDYPATSAALARIEDESADQVARRVEIFWQGAELANAYDELLDAGELARRITANNRMRAARSLPSIAPDEKLLAAMTFLPAAAGVALGIDRLLMRVLGADDIDEVLPFSRHRL